MASWAKSSNLTVYDPKSGVRLRGVRKRPAGRYSAEIRDPEKKLRLLQLGNFDTPEEAARAYDASARKLLGPKAVTNFPPEEEKKHDDDITTTTKEEGFGSTSQNDNAAAAASELILGSTAVVQSEDLLACPGMPDVNLSVSIGSCLEPPTSPSAGYGSSGRQIGGTHEFMQQNYMYWTSFMNYLNCNQQGTELQPLARSITESDVIDYLGHLIKLRERKVHHHRTCPFSRFSPAVCSCQANDGLEGSLINIAYRPNDLHTIAYRLERAFHDRYNQPDRSNPFTSQTVRNYLRVHERSTLIGTAAAAAAAAAAAGGSSHKGGGGGVVVYNAPSGSATADSSTKKAYTLELEAEIDLLKEVNQRLKKEQEEIDKVHVSLQPLLKAPLPQGQITSINPFFSSSRKGAWNLYFDH